MKAIVYHNYGSPDVLRLEDIQTPIPGDDEVLVKIHAVSINSWDWDMLTGKPFEYRLSSGLLKPKNTKIHGCDIAGQVKAAGKNVKHFVDNYLDLNLLQHNRARGFFHNTLPLITFKRPKTETFNVHDL